MSYLSRFNDTLNQMIDDLVDTFPSDTEMRLYQLGLKAAIAADPNIVNNIFYEKVVKNYEYNIKTRNEEFFLNNSYNELKDNGIGSKLDDVICKIKNRWGELSDDNKDIIWKYLHVLVVFSKKLNE